MTTNSDFEKMRQAAMQDAGRSMLSPQVGDGWTWDSKKKEWVRPDGLPMKEFSLGTGVQEHPLYPQLISAIEQAMFGKGKRHGGATKPFLEQPWVHYAKMHGRGFLTGQAAKKLEEAAERLKRGDSDKDSYRQEIRGAIVYLGMALIESEWE